MRIALLAPLLALAAGCARPAAPAAAPGSPAGGVTAAAVDSIVLERTRCYGFCPAYRVSLARSGQVGFQATYPDSAAATGRITPAAFDTLVRHAERIGFAALPERIADAPGFCGQLTTDAPEVTVTLHRATGTRRVQDYLGCHGPPVAALRAFEQEIDRVAGTSRWLPQHTGGR